MLHFSGLTFTSKALRWMSKRLNPRYVSPPSQKAVVICGPSSMTIADSLTSLMNLIIYWKILRAVWSFIRRNTSSLPLTSTIPRLTTSLMKPFMMPKSNQSFCSTTSHRPMLQRLLPWSSITGPGLKNRLPSPPFNCMSVSSTRVPLLLSPLRISIMALGRCQLCTNALQHWQRLGRSFKFMMAVGSSKPSWPLSHTRSIFPTSTNLFGAFVSIIFHSIKSQG